MYLGEIDRGMGAMIARRLAGRLDDHMGPRYEEAFRMHLRRLAVDGMFGPDVTRIGPYWTRGRDQVEIDAVVRRRHLLVIAPPRSPNVMEISRRRWKLNARGLVGSLASPR